MSTEDFRTSNYRVDRTRCGCHPETCACPDFTLWHGDSIVAKGMRKDQLESLVAAANRGASHEPPDDRPTEESRARFSSWLAREMPAGTVIGDPNWWAAKLLNAAYVYLPGYSAPPPVPVQETAWIIDYADVDRRPEHFSGFGAEQAARRRFDQAKVQWTCRLFRCVDDSGYGTGLTKAPAPMCGECGEDCLGLGAGFGPATL